MRDRRSGWSGDEWIGSVARIAIAGTVLPPRKMPGAIAIREPRRQVPGLRDRARRPVALQGKGPRSRNPGYRRKITQEPECIEKIGLA